MINPIKPPKDPKEDIKYVIDDIYKHLTELKNLVMLGQERTGNDMTTLKIVEQPGEARLAIKTARGWVESASGLFSDVTER